MLDQEVIPPYEQIYRLNRRLIQNGDELQHAVITVGGQAVQYWVNWYLDRYGPDLPDHRLITSVDCDYSARKDDIEAIANTLNVPYCHNNDGQPPSLAQFMLLDKDTGKVKEEDGRLFALPGEPEAANVVDIIDHPSGFTRKDFSLKNIGLYTSPFKVKATEPGMPEEHKHILVLNPVACMRSRFSNLIDLKRRPEVEIARINALKIPTYYFLLDQFDRTPFQLARDIYMDLYWLASDKKCLEQQVFWRRWNGPLNEGQQSKDITLHEILKAVLLFLQKHSNDFDIPQEFLNIELPKKIKKLEEKFTRYITLDVDKSARARKGFERNYRND
ncbi:hypothetical protein [Pantoea ananatis]|uniref:hypothetical protein n=1 Tax=Pantoea ananas TaxID=553 RepID=UPI001B302164|nr:hypothetical protein [Pantoea ananatis]